MNKKKKRKNIPQIKRKNRNRIEKKNSEHVTTIFSSISSVSLNSLLETNTHKTRDARQ